MIILKDNDLKTIKEAIKETWVRFKFCQMNIQSTNMKVRSRKVIRIIRSNLRIVTACAEGSDYNAQNPEQVIKEESLIIY